MAKRTPMQELYFKQIRRLRQGLQRWARKLGISLDKSVIPQMPNRVTKKRLQEIKDIKPKQIVPEAINRSTVVDPETGEIITRRQLEQLPQQEQAQYFDYNSAVFNNFYENINKYNDAFRTNMANWIEGLRNRFGDDAVANMLQKGAENGVVIVYTMAYSQEKMLEYISAMLDYLPEVGEITRAEILEAVEQDEYYPTEGIPNYWQYER